MHRAWPTTPTAWESRPPIAHAATAPLAKVANTARLGATVIQHGATVAEAMDAWRAEADGLTLVHPYDDPLVVAGQGTVGPSCSPTTPTSSAGRAGGRRRPVAGPAWLPPDLAPACEWSACRPSRYPRCGRARPGRASGRAPAASVADGIAVKRPGAIALRSSPGTA